MPPLAAGRASAILGDFCAGVFGESVKLPNCTDGVTTALEFVDCRAGMCTPAPLLSQALCEPVALLILDRLEWVVTGACFPACTEFDGSGTGLLSLVVFPFVVFSSGFGVGLLFSCGLRAVGVGAFDPCAALA